MLQSHDEQNNELSNFKNKCDADEKIALENVIFKYFDFENVISRILDVSYESSFHCQNQQVKIFKKSYFLENLFQEKNRDFSLL